MGPAVEKRFKIKGINPVSIVAGGAIFQGDRPDNIIGIFGFGMETARSVADFASGVLELGGLGFRNKSPLFTVAGGVAFKTGLIFLGSQLFFHLLDAVKRMGFFEKVMKL